MELAGEAAGGEEGLALISQTEPPDIVFLDIEMPRMNGFDMPQHPFSKRFTWYSPQP